MAIIQCVGQPQVIKQWGYVAFSQQVDEVTFSVTFPNACYLCVFEHLTNISTSAGWWSTHCFTISKTKAKVFIADKTALYLAGGW